jgi:hypothetical protein
MEIQNVEGKEKSKTILIIGAGSSLSQYANKILNLIEKNNIIVKYLWKKNI